MKIGSTPAKRRRDSENSEDSEDSSSERLWEDSKDSGDSEDAEDSSNRPPYEDPEELGSIQLLKEPPTFTTFSQLSIEIRLQIWRYDLPGPRVVKFLDLEQGGARPRHPLVLQICHESREEALRFLTPLIVKGWTNFFDLENDICLVWDILDLNRIGRMDTTPFKHVMLFMPAYTADIISNHPLLLPAFPKLQTIRFLSSYYRETRLRGTWWWWLNRVEKPMKNPGNRCRVTRLFKHAPGGEWAQDTTDYAYAETMTEILKIDGSHRWPREA